MLQRTDAEAIFQLAQELAALAGETGDEIKLRSAVSRAYYAVFLLAREKMRVVGEHDVHAEVQRRINRRYGSSIGDYLYQMRRRRVAADYEFPPSDPDIRDWKANWEYAERRGRFLMGKFR